MIVVRIVVVEIVVRYCSVGEGKLSATIASTPRHHCDSGSLARSLQD
jgi:hypothetical protein